MSLWVLAKLYPRIAVGLLLAVLLSGWYGVHKFNDWRHARSLAHVTAQRDQAVAQRDAARTEAHQANQSAGIAQATTQRQDAHARVQRASTQHDAEAIHDVVQSQPASCVPADDSGVRQLVEQAISRAKTASDSVSGTPGG